MATETIHRVTAKELHELAQRGETIDLIDVRTPVEFREVHIPFARNVPLDRIEPATVMAARNGASGKPLFVVCRTGNRSEKACEKFLAAGYEGIVNVEGGTLGWDEEDLPVVRGKKAISLERQVRIAAGSLVFLGVMLGWFVNPWLSGLSAFVGAGLVFAGVSDTCGMGMLLADALESGRSVQLRDAM